MDNSENSRTRLRKLRLSDWILGVSSIVGTIIFVAYVTYPLIRGDQGNPNFDPPTIAVGVALSGGLYITFQKLRSLS